MTAIAAVACFADSKQVSHKTLREMIRVLIPQDTLSMADLFGPPTFKDYIVLGNDTIHFDFTTSMARQPLTERDYREVAKRLGIEVALIKAVVEIETGKIGRGFNSDGSPVICFDIMVYRTMTSRHHINLANYTKSHPLVFERPDVARFGSPQLAQHARLKAALSIDSLSAIEGTFWGMFQLGGFNWKRCGADSQVDFMRRVSRSERDQLDMFAAFLENSGLLKHLRSKNWAAFARGYNGPNYTKHAYDTRLAEAYYKYLGHQ